MTEPKPETHTRVVVGYAPELPDVPIFIARSRDHGKTVHGKTAKLKTWRITVQIEELPDG